MNRRYLVALSLLLTAAITACAGGVSEAPPVFVTNPQGNRVEALAMTTPRAPSLSVRNSVSNFRWSATPAARSSKSTDY